MEYNFREIEKKWHDYWIAEKVYKVEKDTNKPKYYVLDMFPYPSGAGLHVGHPLGYIASDIYSRFKRLQGFNVLHPMGYDAYGLPAEQYAIQTGQHPEITTKNNIARYREQLEKIGFCYDWSREIRTCDPEYYKWTQWAFIRMFNSYYCNDEKQARPISELTCGIVEIAHRNYSKRLHFDSTREFSEVATSFNDMAERLEEYQQSSLATLLSSKKYLEAIVNSIHEPIIGLNHDRQILFVNNEALTVLNLKREQMIHQSADELSLKNDLLRRLIRELVHPNEKHEPLKIYADDKESFFQAVYVPIKLTETETEGEKQVGNVILLKNITEFKELDSAKTTFISTISHELKTPISAIMMSLKLLEDQRIGSLNDEQQSLASSIKENSDRLLNITGELLKLTQVETGKLILSPKITKPIELINYAVSATRVLAERFGCNIEVEYPEKIHKLFVDSEKIAWVITNLLSNAIHYSKENSRIIVGAKEVDQTIQIFVQDFGKGIDPRYHQSIFDRYFRVPGTKVQGSGLGLAISKDFVEAHDGKIWVESEIGKGSKFTIAFPVR